ncbi:MAG TPA: family 1 glycosylhydrolase [Chloroflexia bacterium]|nr:family 1 glycosylhydrolase [Chloroflexia bacterium]
MSQRDFQWMTGFECSAFPQIGADELAATQHDRWWASDLVRVRDLGMTLIRYGIPWPRVNPRPHEYDWQWTDQVLDLLQTLEITPIVDLFHYGTPAWIEGGIMHPIFGEIQSWYAQAFAERYPQIVYYLPTSEPYVCATFGAEFALWHPFLRGPRNAARAIKNVTEGLCRSMLAIRRVRPEALLVVADTCEYYQALDDAFAEEAAFRSLRRFLVHDLYQGQVTPEHPLWPYLVEQGVEDWELAWFLRNPVRLDILGLDYYQHSEHQLRAGPAGARIDETAAQPLGWAELARQYSTRYGDIPVVLAETNVGGPVADRLAWLDALVAQTRQARAAGTPVAGLTYYGAIDHVDWDTVLRQRNRHINPCGMWALEWHGNRLVRKPTAVVDWFRGQIALPVERSVGPLASEVAQARVRAVLAPAAGG